MKRKIKKFGNVLTAAQQKKIFGGVKSTNAGGNTRLYLIGPCYMGPGEELIYVKCDELCPDGGRPICLDEPLLP